MLSTFYLSFKDQESSEIYYRQRQDYYARAFPLLALTQAGLTAALIMVSIRNRNNNDALSETLTYVNLGATAIFMLFSVLVRFSKVVSWFACPALTGLAFYYFAFLDYSQDNVSAVFAIVVAINTCYFILALFNEVWLISTSVYAPLLLIYMLKMGEDFTGADGASSETFVRCIFCILLYGVVAYSTEKSHKQSFLSQESGKMAQSKWLKIFEKFPDGVALINEDNQIEYANQSLSELLEFKDYLGGVTDAENQSLKKHLENTMLQPLPKDEKHDDAPVKEAVTAWSMIEYVKDSTKDISHGPCRLQALQEKYLSINTVAMSLPCNNGKLFVVRDMTTMATMQETNSNQKLFNKFTEKIISQIQASAVQLMDGLQGLRTELDSSSVELGPFLTALSDAKKIAYRTLDFEQIFNINEGTSSVQYDPHKADTIIQSIKSIVQPALEARDITLDLQVEETFPSQVNTHFQLLIQVILNAISSVTHSATSTNLVLNASGYQTEAGVEAIFEITCDRINLTKEEVGHIRKVSDATDLSNCLEGDSCDTNIAVAKIICLDLGWHIEFRQNDSEASGNFLLVIPALRYNQQTNLSLNKIPNQDTTNLRPLNLLAMASQSMAEQQIISERKIVQENADPFDSPRSDKEQLNCIEENNAVDLHSGPKKEILFDDIDPEEESEQTMQVYSGSATVDCLLVSCGHEKQFMMHEFNLRSDEAITQAHALELLKRSFEEKRPYRFVLLDLDDPTLYIGRFIRSLEQLLIDEPDFEDIAIDVYACSDNNSPQMLKKVASHKVFFLHKPLTRENCLSFAEKYPVPSLDSQNEAGNQD